MSPSISTACLLLLLLLLCPPLVSCGRSPPSLQGARKDRIGREEHPHPGHTVRKPKVDPGELTSVLDVSDDVDQEPDIAGLYTGASLNKPGMAPEFRFTPVNSGYYTLQIYPRVYVNMFRVKPRATLGLTRGEYSYEIYEIIS